MSNGGRPRGFNSNSSIAFSISIITLIKYIIANVSKTEIFIIMTHEQ